MIRGLGGYRVQTLQDGLASLDVAGLSQDHAVTVESVVSQQIEVIKGPRPCYTAAARRVASSMS